MHKDIQKNMHTNNNLKKFEKMESSGIKAYQGERGKKRST